MAKSTISLILDKAVTEAYDHHTETMDYHAQDSVLLAQSTEIFLISLTDDQRKLYDEMERHSITVDGEINEKYYRLGFIDGLNAWRGTV